MRILLTGATGFIAPAVAREIRARRMGELVLPVRARPAQAGEWLEVGDIGPATDWSRAVAGVNVVIHCAGRAHVMVETDADPLQAFRAVNVEGSLGLAEAAAAAGARRFIFLSSVKVHGEESGAEGFRATDGPAPADAYARSKWEAEQALARLCERTAMELVVIRPPLVYGPGVKANFRSMMRWLRRGVPLPLGAIHNRRSLVGLGNLVDLIVTCIGHPAAAGLTFLVSDGEDLSTTELLRRLGAALGHPARLVPVPGSLLAGLARLVGRQAMAQRLCGSLRVDIEPTRERLQWTPPVPVDDALRETAAEFLSSRPAHEANATLAQGSRISNSRGKPSAP